MWCGQSQILALYSWLPADPYFLPGSPPALGTFWCLWHCPRTPGCQSHFPQGLPSQITEGMRSSILKNTTSEKYRACVSSSACLVRMLYRGGLILSHDPPSLPPASLKSCEQPSWARVHFQFVPFCFLSQPSLPTFPSMFAREGSREPNQGTREGSVWVPQTQSCSLKDPGDSGRDD